jgi:hypothetical protein
MIVSDCTFTTSGVFKHTLLLAVTFDGNNKLVVLAFAAVDIENEENWVWFLQKLINDFPGIAIFMADAEKGITSQAFQDALASISALSSRCARHLAGNCRDNIQVKLSKDQEQFIITKIAKARTEVMYNERLEELTTLNEQAAAWVDERKDEFVAFRFLQREKPRFGKVTSNGVENINSAILDIREQPIASMTAQLVARTIKQQCEAKSTAEKWCALRQSRTDYGEAMHAHTLAIARTRMVTVEYRAGPVVKGSVSHTIRGDPLHEVQVAVNTDTFTITCPCAWWEEMGSPCFHGMALITEARLIPDDMGWYHQRYHAATSLRMYSASVPNFGIMGRLVVREMIPPEWKRTAGHQG